MRVYALRKDDGRRVLVAIRCDGCGAEIRPDPTVTESGWEKYGWDYGLGMRVSAEVHYCPVCQGGRR